MVCTRNLTNPKLHLAHPGPSHLGPFGVPSGLSWPAFGFLCWPLGLLNAPFGSRWALWAPFAGPLLSLMLPFGLPLGLPLGFLVLLGLPWAPFAGPLVSLMIPFGLPLGLCGAPSGLHWGPLGSLWWPLGLLKAPLGLPFGPFGFPWAPLGSLGPPWALLVGVLCLPPCFFSACALPFQGILRRCFWSFSSSRPRGVRIKNPS